MKSYTIKVNNKFWVGDMAYSIKDTSYYGIWGEKNDFADGAYTDTNGYEFAVVGTAYGDGQYYGRRNGKIIFVFPVDAGNIGIADVEACDQIEYSVQKELGMVIEFSGEVTISYDEGVIKVEYGQETITVDTNY